MRDGQTTRFVTVNRDTASLVSPSVEDWLPKDYLARFVVDIAEQWSARRCGLANRKDKGET
jgi:hypothetical protein